MKGSRMPSEWALVSGIPVIPVYLEPNGPVANRMKRLGSQNQLAGQTMFEARRLHGMSESERTRGSGSSLRHASMQRGTGEGAPWIPFGAKATGSVLTADVAGSHLQRGRLGKLSSAALIGCLVFAGIGLVIYVLPVLLYVLAGDGSLRNFGDFANVFTVPAIVSLWLGLACLVFSVVGYFVVLFKKGRC